MNWIVKIWRGYIAWCDEMGLTPENRRCCAPRLEEPELVSTKPVSKTCEPSKDS